jgi:hypothetical protein
VPTFSDIPAVKNVKHSQLQKLYIVGIHADNLVGGGRGLPILVIWRDLWKPRKTSLRIVGNPAEIQTRYQPNTNLELLHRNGRSLVAQSMQRQASGRKGRYQCPGGTLGGFLYTTKSEEGLRNVWLPSGHIECVNGDQRVQLATECPNLHAYSLVGLQPNCLMPSG